MLHLEYIFRLTFEFYRFRLAAEKLEAQRNQEDSLFLISDT